MSYKLPKLPYSYSALEPYIDTKTMRIHHDKHHAGYVAKLNTAISGKKKLEKMTIEELIANLNQLPTDVKLAVKNNGGGHINHSMFWKVMTPAKSSGSPKGKLMEALQAQFGTFESFKEKFTQEALTRFGSGWAWLVIEKNRLKVESTPNQDSPLSRGKTPVLGIDVWEHAYYLKYQNKRADYVKAWWNVVNWKEVGKNFTKAMHN